MREIVDLISKSNPSEGVKKSKSNSEKPVKVDKLRKSIDKLLNNGTLDKKINDHLKIKKNVPKWWIPM